MHAIRARHAFDGRTFLPGAGHVADRGPTHRRCRAGVDLPDLLEMREYSGTVLPRLIDAHTHLVADATFGGLERAATLTAAEVDQVITDSLRAHAAAGVTTVRDLGDIGYRTLPFRDRPGLPRVVPSGPPVTTPQGHCHFLGGAVHGDLSAAVDERVARGVDAIKVMASGGFATPGSDQLGAQFDTAELTELVHRAHAAGVPVVAHALAAGVDDIEHFTGLTAQGPRIENSLLDEVARRGVRVCLTMGNDTSAHAHMPAPPPAVAHMLATLGIASLDEFYQTRIAVLGRLREHGVTVVAGVDSGMMPAKRHGNTWRTVGEMVQAGYTTAHALAAATSLAADVCGLAGQTGRLAPGHCADILIVEGDLEHDPTLLGAPVEVLIRGRWVAPLAGGSSCPARSCPSPRA